MQLGTRSSYLRVDLDLAERWNLRFNLPRRRGVIPRVPYDQVRLDASLTATAHQVAWADRRRTVMADIMNGDDLEAWLKGKPPELACVLAARVALRVVPVLQYALHEMEEDRRCTIVLLSFRALAAVNCAATWPTRGVEIRNAARGAACDAGDAMADISRWRARGQRIVQ